MLRSEVVSDFKNSVDKTCLQRFSKISKKCIKELLQNLFLKENQKKFNGVDAKKFPFLKFSFLKFPFPWFSLPKSSGDSYLQIL